METIKEVLMRRDGYTSDEADEHIAYARSLVDDGEDPEDVCMDEFGLEPDYAMDLLF